MAPTIKPYLIAVAGLLATIIIVPTPVAVVGGAGIVIAIAVKAQRDYTNYWRFEEPFNKEI